MHCEETFESRMPLGGVPTTSERIVSSRGLGQWGVHMPIVEITLLASSPSTMRKIRSRDLRHQTKGSISTCWICVRCAEAALTLSAARPETQMAACATVPDTEGRRH